MGKKSLKWPNVNVWICFQLWRKWEQVAVNCVEPDWAELCCDRRLWSPASRTGRLDRWDSATHSAHLALLGNTADLNSCEITRLWFVTLVWFESTKMVVFATPTPWLMGGARTLSRKVLLAASSSSTEVCPLSTNCRTPSDTGRPSWYSGLGLEWT